MLYVGEHRLLGSSEQGESPFRALLCCQAEMFLTEARVTVEEMAVDSIS